MSLPTTPRDLNRRMTTKILAQPNAAGKICGFIAWLIAVLSLTPVIQVRATANDLDPPTREVIEELKQLYATEITLGKPLEIDGLKIIPLATIGVGFGQRIGAPDREVLRGAGGVLSPVGILVVANKGVQLLPVSKGFFEQVLGAITPVILQVIRARGQDAVDASNAPPAPVSLPELLATFYAFVPERGLKFGLFPWPLLLVLIYVSGWLVLALLIGVFLPRQLVAIASTLQANALRSAVLGLLSYGAIFMLAVVFTISIIGIPFTVLLLVFTWGANLLGTVSIAWLVGQKVLGGVGRAHYPEVVYVLIGGIMLGVVRIIPVLGWILWSVLGVFGFGAVLRTQMQR